MDRPPARPTARGFAVIVGGLAIGIVVGGWLVVRLLSAFVTTTQ